jgi:hypothetical protein
MIRNGITGHNVNKKTENFDETGKPKSIRSVQECFLIQKISKRTKKMLEWLLLPDVDHFTAIQQIKMFDHRIIKYSLDDKSKTNWCCRVMLIFELILLSDLTGET